MFHFQLFPLLWSFFPANRTCSFLLTIHFHLIKVSVHYLTIDSQLDYSPSSLFTFIRLPEKSKFLSEKITLGEGDIFFSRKLFHQFYLSTFQANEVSCALLLIKLCSCFWCLAKSDSVIYYTHCTWTMHFSNWIFDIFRLLTQLTCIRMQKGRGSIWKANIELNFSHCFLLLNSFISHGIEEHILCSFLKCVSQ